MEMSAPPGFQISYTYELVDDDDDDDDDDDNDDDDNIKAIFGPQWHLRWVSPLRNLQFTEARLKQYALHLRGAVQSDGSVVQVDAKVKPLAELRRDESAPVPLQISIDSLDGEKRQCLYNGILLSWKKPRRPEQNNLVNLPLLLCRGRMKTIQLVHNMLQNLFDCSIKGMTFEREHMLWLIGIAAHYYDAEFDDLNLRFICPGLGDKNYLDFTMHMTVLKEIWRSIHKPDQRNVTYDEIKRLTDRCFTSLEEIYGVKLKMLQLIRIHWKGCLLSINGRIKFSRDLAKKLLGFVEDVGYGQEKALAGMLYQGMRARQDKDS